MKTSAERILIVDDNAMNRKLAAMLLKKLGYESQAVTSGMEALELLREKQFELILMDYRMPEMDGIEAAEKIRDMEGDYFQAVPIIALTGEEREEVRQSFWDAGMNDILDKPLDSGKLEAVLKRWLAGQIIASNAEPEAQMSVNGWAPEALAALERAGISIQDGIKNCSGEELFRSLLEDFYHLIDFKAEKMEKYLAAGQLKEYTIEVHALKNSARLIGALELSEKFANQERLGNNGDLAEVKKNAPALLQHMSRCKGALEIVAAGNTTVQKKVSAAQMKDVLYAMRDAADTFNLDGVDEAMEELDGYQWPAECEDYKERLKAYAADVALEDILQGITEIVHILEKTE